MVDFASVPIQWPGENQMTLAGLERTERGCRVEEWDGRRTERARFWSDYTGGEEKTRKGRSSAGRREEVKVKVRQGDMVRGRR